MKSSAQPVIEGPWNEDCDLPVVLEPGEYEACYVRHSCRKIYDKPRIVMAFRITSPGPGFGLLLDRFWVVNETSKGRWTVSKYSNLAKDISRLFPWYRRPCKSIQGALKDLFTGKIFLVEVATVNKDNRQREMEQGYSIIKRIARIVEGLENG